jgi:predicted ferric reductase
VKQKHRLTVLVAVVVMVNACFIYGRVAWKYLSWDALAFLIAVVLLMVTIGCIALLIWFATSDGPPRAVEGEK